MDVPRGEDFFREATAIQGSATPHVLFEIVSFGLLATATGLASAWLEQCFNARRQRVARLRGGCDRER